jgi:hypothetical protein
VSAGSGSGSGSNGSNGSGSNGSNGSGVYFEIVITGTSLAEGNISSKIDARFTRYEDMDESNKKAYIVSVVEDGIVKMGIVHIDDDLNVVQYTSSTDSTDSRHIRHEYSYEIPDEQMIHYWTNATWKESGTNKFGNFLVGGV